MKTGRAVETAYRALLLADDLRERLVRLERKARKRARRGGSKRTSAVPEGFAPLDALAASIPFNTESWQVSLAPVTDTAARSEVA